LGNILSEFKEGLVNDLVDSITSNTNQFYVFAANPILNAANSAKPTTYDDYSNLFTPSWALLFGKKLANSSIKPIIKNNQWIANTVYDRYDNTSNTLYDSDNFYVVTDVGGGGGYNIYICVDNASGTNSTYKPDLLQPSTFETDDGYKWRYVTTISSQNYTYFATDEYIPIYPNTGIVASASTYAGIEVIPIDDAGSGYNSYHDGVVRSVVNTTLIQIDSTASLDDDFYNDNGIYIYNTTSGTAQVLVVDRYVSNVSGSLVTNWVHLTTPANTDDIVANSTEYKISPRVVIDSDATVDAKAYTTINAVANTISSVVIVDSGTQVTWANVSLVSNSHYPELMSGNRASVHAIVPPPGGFGYNPARQLGVKGMALSFTFSNSEGGTITTDTTYNIVGLLKNPYSINSTSLAKHTRFSGNTFSQLLVANVFPSTTFSNGDVVTGVTSGAKGVVVYSNSTQVALTGDRNFAEGEYILSSDGLTTANISINTVGDLYTKDISILYVTNINDVQRASDQSERFKAVLKV
jgi:hypothetical protein